MPATPTGSVDELAVAKTNYAKMCQNCHGADGGGGTVTIEDKTLKVPSLKEGHAVTHTDQQLVKQVLDGGESMPAFKDKLSAKDAANVVTFVKRQFQNR